MSYVAHGKCVSHDDSVVMLCASEEIAEVTSRALNEYRVSEVGYHVTTAKKLARYDASGCILSPVRFWPTFESARDWARKTGRSVILEIRVTRSYPLPDHRPARFCPDNVTDYKVV